MAGNFEPATMETISQLEAGSVSPKARSMAADLMAADLITVVSTI